METDVTQFRETVVCNFHGEQAGKICLLCVENRIAVMEKSVSDVCKGHEFFMQTLEDAVKEILGNNMARVMLSEAMREKLTKFVELREQFKIERTKNVQAINAQKDGQNGPQA